MDAIELLNDDLAELPRPVSARPYGENLRETLLTYAAAAEGLTGDDYASREVRSSGPRIRELSERLLAVHAGALAGIWVRAYEELKNAMALVTPELMVLKSKPLDGAGMGVTFRLRQAASSEKLERGGLFHIPFESRHLVGPQRYSSLGIPMLYLGSTLFVCWEELGRPSFEQVWVSAFRLRSERTVRVLNLGYRPALMAALLDQTKGADNEATRFVVAQAVLWPLIAACSFPKRFPNARFVEEYVIPQQVIAYVLETGEFDGVRYFSNRVNPYGGEMLAQNFVFPAQPGHSQGYCPKLLELFEATPPMPWSMVTLLGSPLNQGDPLIYARRGTLEAYPGHTVDYQQTQFAKVEAHLLQQNFQPIC